MSAVPDPVLAGAPLDWSRLDRVLAVRLDNLGDVVMVTPALRALRAALRPGARLDLLASPGGAALAPLLPWVDEVHALRAVWQDASGALPAGPGPRARPRRAAAGVRRRRGVHLVRAVAATRWPTPRTSPACPCGSA